MMISSRLIITSLKRANLSNLVISSRSIHSLQSRGTIPNANFVTHNSMSGLNFPNLAKEDIEKLLIQYNYQMSMPCVKRLGYDLIKGFNYWMKLPSDLIEVVNNVWLAGYEAAVSIDDIIDESDYRRTLPSSPRIFGTSRCFIYSHAQLFFLLKKIMELKNDKVVEMYIDNITMYMVGLNKEANFRENKICPNMNEFEQLCLYKCSGITNLPINLMQILSECQMDFSRLLYLYNFHLQYSNDLSILWEPKVWNSKAFCEDISQGNISLATLHAINSGTIEGEIVRNILFSKTKDLPTLKYCQSLLIKLGSIDFVQQTLISIENQMREEIKRLGGNPPLLEHLDSLVALAYDEEHCVDEKKSTSE